MEIKKTVVLAAVFLLFLMTGFAYLRHKSASDGERGSYAITSNNSQHTAVERGSVRMIRFVMFTDGLYPHQLTINAGRINLAFEDKTNISEGLLIDRVVGNERSNVGRVRRIGNDRRGRDLIRLTPGRYIVSDASRAQNTAQLTVLP